MWYYNTRKNPQYLIYISFLLYPIVKYLLLKEAAIDSCFLFFAKMGRITEDAPVPGCAVCCKLAGKCLCQILAMGMYSSINLIKNAKARCDYLIVGVNSDELVLEYKNKVAIVSLSERMEIVRSLKYVDEVMRIDSLDKRISWKEKHYDILFIGDDWKGNPRWEATKEEMLQYGVKTIFLPHTQGTTSTMLREKLIEY